MPPQVTYSGVKVASTEISGSLFAGKSFFLTQRLPLRSRYVKDIEANGGSVVRLEAQADYLIADHLRSDCPPGSLSYTFIDRAIQTGELPPVGDHVAGVPKGASGAARPPRAAGSSAPVKTVRTPYTTQDDEHLLAWVRDGQANGYAVKGAELYKLLEAENSRHPWQSWRERYLRNLALRPPTSSPAPSPSTTTVAALPSNAEVTQPISPTPTALGAVRGRATARRPGKPVLGRSARRPVSAESAVPDEEQSMVDRPVAGPQQDAINAVTEMKGPKLDDGADVSEQAVGTTVQVQYTDTGDLSQMAETEAENQDTLLEAPVQEAPVVVQRSRESSLPQHTPRPEDDLPITVANSAGHEELVLEQAMVSSNVVAPAVGVRQDPIEATLDASKPSKIGVELINAPRQEFDFSAIGFDDNDFRRLFDNAEYIQSVPVGRYNKIWYFLAAASPPFTAEQLRKYYEQVVYPEYEKTEKPDEDLKALESQSLQDIEQYDYRKILDVFGTQGQPDHNANGLVSNLKTMASSNDQDTLLPSTTPTSKTPAEHPAGSGLDRTPEEPQVKETPVKNASARITKRTMADTQSQGPQKRQKVSTSNPTISREPQGSASKTVVHAVVISSDESSDDQSEDLVARTEAGETTYTSEMDAEAQHQLQHEMEQTRPIALTAENLARAQALGNPRSDRRALDVAVDDGNKDQTDMADYLQGLIGQGPPESRIDRQKFDALKEKHRRLKCFAHEEASDEYHEQDSAPHKADGAKTIVVNGRVIDTKDIPDFLRTQDLDPDIDRTVAESSPLRRPPSDRPAPLNPDSSPHQSPLHGFQSQDIDPRIRDMDSHGDSGSIQLAVVEPEGGWNFMASQSPQPSRPAKLQDREQGRTPVVIDTQYVFGGETQIPDLHVAEPSSQYELQVHSAESELDSQAMDGSRVEAFENAMIARGHDPDDIDDVLYMTSMRAPLCERVLEDMKAGRGQPTDLPGFWTQAEDDWLQGGNAVKLRKLAEKHGVEEFDARTLFLADWHKQ
ncbi:hypothetical protein AAFC00_006784 [Neodothiora populina]|uniref:DNA-binding protein RAP1 n=1 Tax=Neodothiora populina TaxID=2781224 RepID=A0ABR3PBB1_9PEZI